MCAKPKQQAGRDGQLEYSWWWMDSGSSSSSNSS